jgi:DNA-binding PadR family transcriptional regulator
MKYVILRLLREKPSHGYELIKAMEDRFGGWYSPSPGTVYPTLQLLEDQGYVRVVETEGRKTYHITPKARRSWISTAIPSTKCSTGCARQCAISLAALWVS